MSEKAFSVDAHPTAELSESLLAAAKSYVECDLVRAGIFVGFALSHVTHPDMPPTFVMSSPATIDDALERTIGELLTSWENVVVHQITPLELAAQQKADMEHIDFEFQLFDRL